MKFHATEHAPGAIGPYSQAVTEGGFLFASGQIPIDPATGELVAGGIQAAPSRVLGNIEAVLKSARLGFSGAAKTPGSLVQGEAFPAMNAVYAARFGEHRPARSTVIVAALPKGAMVEIDLIAKTR